MNQPSTICFQGHRGAYSHLACLRHFPDLAPIARPTFEAAFAACREGEADLAMIPIDNTVAGRVADVHHLVPGAGLAIVGEKFLRVRHCLLGVRGASLHEIEIAESHVHAVGQCRRFLREHGIAARVVGDTAGGAEDVAIAGDPRRAAIASSLAAEIYQLDVLATGIEDADHNTTRFLVMARERDDPLLGGGPCITSILFRVRNVPAALYKAMGGFATNKVNMIKLESYVGEGFEQAQFFAEIAGHPEEDGVRHALEELDFFTDRMRVLGVYRADPFREGAPAPE